jgi:uncharacterized protein (TIGR02996 family)
MVLHPDAKAFVTRILADPSDAVIRTIFADWLADQGGTGNENWAGYIRLRTDAALAHGTDRELLREEADQLAPHLKARLTVPAAKFAPNFHHFLDVLPADRYIVTLGGYEFPAEPNERLGAMNAKAARSLVLTERDGVYAIVTDMLLPGLARVLGQRLNGRAILFPSFTNEIDDALERVFPPPPPAVSEPTPIPEELNRKMTRATALRLVTEAREAHATQLEIVAQPSGYEVRFVIGGRPRRKEGFSTEIGERVVQEFFTADAYTRLQARARPRNTSFGKGAEVDV